jgi:hypothetical protein
MLATATCVTAFRLAKGRRDVQFAIQDALLLRFRVYHRLIDQGLSLGKGMVKLPIFDIHGVDLADGCNARVKRWRYRKTPSGLSRYRRRCREEVK